MSIPASYLETLRDRVSIAETIGRRISFDPQKSIPAKGDYWACCPFHGEKTPSFHVLDRQGYFYCFGCHEKGSAIDFVMKNDRLSFPEAVELLAAEAGMAPPPRDAREAKREQKRATLSEATEAAVAFFRDQLDSAAGREARDYLEQERRLTRETIERFEIGFAPNSWESAAKALKAQGFDDELLIGADICARSDRDGSLYDRFRNRIMFPIRDTRGRCVGFGGRAMAQDDKTAKYLNSRETELFKKSRTLYNLGRARERLGDDRPLLVVEGYMDVIALAQAGFATAVAPLGTALTEQQLEMLWKVADEPIMALDGDAAGQRAAERAAYLALPKLRPGKSLGFATLPPGQDPDDLAREGGAPAVETLVARADPLIDLLWRRSTEDARIDTPERRAALEQAQRELVDRIEDKSVKSRYGDAFYERRRQFYWRKDREARDAAFRRKGGKGGKRGAVQPGPSQEARAKALEEATLSDDKIVQREGAILLLLLEHPQLWEQRADQAEELDFIDPALDSVKNALLCGVAAIDDQERATEGEQPGNGYDVSARRDALDQFVDQRCGAGASHGLRERLKKRLGGPFSAPPQSIESVCRLFDELAALHGADLTWRREIEAYKAELLDGAAEDEEPHRLKEAQKQLLRSQGPSEQENADPGALSGRLQAFVDAEPWVKRRKRG